MGTLTGCLSKLGKALTADDAKTLKDTQAEYQASGMSPQEAALKAIDDFRATEIDGLRPVVEQITAKGGALPDAIATVVQPVAQDATPAASTPQAAQNGQAFTGDERATESNARPAVVAWAKRRFGDATAPNGRKVWQNFVEWFGDSQVVDAKGQPLVMFHGTSAADKIRASGFKKGWIHTSSSKDVADSYQAWDRGGSKDTLAVYVKTEKPAYFDAKGAKYTDIGNKIFSATWDAEKAGHDALIIQNIRDNFDSSVPTEPHTTVVTFSPAQIKSATENSGAFDPSEPSILKSSRAQPAEDAFQGITPDQARNIARDAWGGRLVKRLTDSGILNFVTSEEARKIGVDAPLRATEGDRVAGFYVDGKAYIVADQIKPEEVAGVVLHEVGEHYGMERMLGTDLYNRLLRLVERRGKSGTDPEIRKAWESAKSAGTPDANMAQETLAYLLEQAPGNGIVTRAVDAIKSFLNRLGVPMSRLENEAELLRRVGRESMRMAGKEGAVAIRVRKNGTLYHRAWHGSPHDHDGFRLDKIGTGEGAQAYGWGLYFAGKKEVAEFYRDVLSKRRQGNDLNSRVAAIRVDGKPLGENIELDERLAEFAENADEFGAALYADERASRWETLSKDETYPFKDYARDHAKAWRDLLKSLESGAKITSTYKGRLYEVDLAPQEDEYLDWDRPLSEQSEKVQAAARSIYKQINRDALADYLDRLNADEMELTGGEFYRLLTRAVMDDATPIEDRHVSMAEAGRYDAVASRILHEDEGIPGIRYLDGTSRGAGDGSRNYVIFDDSLVKITAKYSRRKADDTPNLIVQHNLTADKLMHALRVGGLAVPSLAVTTVDRPIKGFGEITLLGDSGLVDPKGPARTRVFGADIYSPRYPRIDFKLKADALKRLNDALAPYRQEGDRELYGSDVDKPDDLVSNKPFQRYLEAKKGKPESDMRYQEMMAGAAELLREVGGEEVIFMGFTNSGNRRYKPHDLQTVVGILKKELRGGENFNYHIGSTRAKFTPQFRSITQIRQNKGRLTSKEEFQRVKDEVEAEFLAISSALESSYPRKPDLRFTDSVLSVIEDAAKIGVPRALERYDFKNVPEDTMRRIGEFMVRLRNMPTEYFEAKILRAVELPEFRAAVVPDNADPTVFRELRAAGLEVEQYKAGDEADRARAVREFTERKPELLFSRRTPQQAQAEAAQNRATLRQQLPAPGQWNWSATAAQRRDGWRKELIRQREVIQDRMLVFRDARDAIREQGAVLADAANVYTRENLSHGRAGERITRLERDHVNPLIVAMKQADVKPELLEDYLEAAHARERNEAIAKINPNMPDGGSGISTADADAFLNGQAAGSRSGVTITPAQRAELATLADRVKAVTAMTRKTLLDAGIIDKAKFDAMEKAYQEYVPLRNRDGVEAGYERIGTTIRRVRDPIKRALGRGEGNRAENILAEVFGDAQRAIILSEKARVDQTLLRMALEHPNDQVWEVEPVKTEQAFSEASGEVYTAVQNIDREPGTVIVPWKGKKYRVLLKDVRMADAYNRLSAENLNAVFRFMGALNRWFSAVLTRYNPGFVAVNLARDFQLGLTGVAAEHGMEAAAKVAAGYPSAMRAMYRQSAGKAARGKWGTYAEEFAADGGKTAFGLAESVEDIQQRIGAEFKTAWKMVRERRPGMAIRKWLASSTIIQTIEQANDAVENAIRLSTYVALREKGLSREKAAQYAKDLTVNFNRRGQQTSILNAFYLFFNAAVQGSHRVIKLIKDNPGKMSAVLGTLAATQAISALFAMGMADDDDEDAWSKIPDWEKQRNLIFVYPTVKDGKTSFGTIKVPMPYGFNVFPYAGGRIAQLAMDLSRGKDVKAGKFTNDIAAGLSGAFAPLPLEQQGWRAALPYFANIGLALQTNKDDLGRRITNEQPYSKFEMPRVAYGRDDTPEPFVVAARALNRLGGGDDYTKPMAPALLDWSPDDLEFLVTKFTGGIGSTTVKAWKFGEGLLAGIPMTQGDAPLVSSFWSVVNDRQAAAGAYYDRRDELERELARIRDAVAQGGDASEAIKITAGDDLKATRRSDGAVVLKGGEDSLLQTYRAAEKRMGEIRDRIQAIYNDPNIKPLERRRQVRALQDERAEVQREFNRRWREAEREQRERGS